MLRGADYKLSENQIYDRNQMIEELKTCLHEFNKIHLLDLPLKRFESRLEPGLPDNIVMSPPPIFDEDWLVKQRNKIREDLIKHLGKHILSKVPTMQQGRERLAGSSNAIADRLCYFLIQNSSESTFELGCDTSSIGLKYYEIVDFVSEEYERTYKTYRLWNDRALGLLGDYLFWTDNDCTIFEGEAIWGELTSEGEPVSLDEFIEAVDSALQDLPRDKYDFAEFLYPDDSGVDFTDYVPAENMSPAQKAKLYKKYVSSLSS